MIFILSKLVVFFTQMSHNQNEFFKNAKIPRDDTENYVKKRTGILKTPNLETPKLETPKPPRTRIDGFSSSELLESIKNIGLSGDGEILVSEFIQDNELDGDLLMYLDDKELKEHLEGVKLKDWIKLRQFLSK